MTTFPSQYNIAQPLFGQCRDGGNQRIRACNNVLPYNELAVARLAQRLLINWWRKATADTET